MATIMRFLIFTLLFLSVSVQAQLNPTAFSKAQVNTNDTPAKWANNIGVLDINSNSGISGGPEYAWTNATPKYSGQIGVVKNSSLSALYHSTGTGKGNWWGNWLFNGNLQVGTDYHNTNATSSDIALKVIGNGSTNFISDTGVAGGSEQTVVVMQKDPRQGTYINWSAPSAVSMPARTVTMSNPVDFQMGVTGIHYGTNTLGGLPFRNDGLIALNQGVDFFFTTTENKGIYGTRAFYEYDNTNGVHLWPVDRADNGIMGTPGHQVVLLLDAKNKTITSTNAAISLTGGTVVLGTSGTFQINGANSILIGAGGTANNAGISGSALSLNTDGSLGTPSILNRTGSRFQYVNFDSSGHTQIGKYVNGTSASDVYLHFASDHSHGWLNQAMKVGANSAPTSCAVLDVESTTKGFLLPRMTKAQRDAISSPVAGLAVYQTDNTPGLRVYNGSNWMRYTETAD